MKNFIICSLFACTFITPSFSSASETTCTGKVWVWTAFFPVPLHRNIILKISPSLSELKNPISGQVHIDAEGEPIDYQGMIYPRGDQDQKMIDPNNGDIAEFSINVLSAESVRFQLSFLSSDAKAQGGIRPATLSCH
ncbi:hypothetical protein H7Y21_00050 [Arenimonas sp.]|nr:hypothetical protein [Candidatus Parcubacteria bacterium]